MNNYQLNRFKMYGMVTDYLKDHLDKLNDFPGFKENYSVFLNMIEKISNDSRQQYEYARKESIMKKELRRDLEEKMLETSQKLKAYAILNQDHILLPNCSYTKWGLSRLRNLDLFTHASNLYKNAKDHLSDVVQFSIDADDLKDLKEKNDLFWESIPEHRLDEVSSSVATKNMAEAYSEADKALKYIDLTATIIGKSDHDFYSGYKNYRKQIKSGTVKMALKAQATEKDSGKPVAHVTFTFLLTKPFKVKGRKNFKIVKKTKHLGGFKIMHMPAGEYDVVINKPGYKESQVEITVEDSVLLRMKVEMEKI